MSCINIFTDGAAKGNPGPSGIGIVIKDENGSVISEHFEYTGISTNNAAEYKALLKSIEATEKIEKDFDVINFYLDSKLVVHQIRGEFKIKNKDLIKLSLEFWKKIKALNKNFTISHIPREENSLADKLANKAIKEYAKVNEE